VNASLLKGPIQMLFSAFCFAVMAYFAKLASVNVPGPEVVFFRFLLGVVAAWFLAALGRVDLRTSRRDLLFARGIFGGTAILLYFIAMAKGSMTNSTVLNNTYPIFVTMIAAFFMKERVSVFTWLCLIVSWAGVGLLIHPDLHRIFWPDILALISGILSAFAVLVVRQLRQNGESAWTVFFYLSIFGLLVSLVFAIPVWQWPDATAWLFLLATAVTGLVAQITMTSAYKYCSAATGSILSMTTMVFAAVFGMAWLGEKLSTGEAMGAVLIALGGGAIAWMSNKEQTMK
jgi:drug/metabolite transporter (DMT)-like permease